MPPPVCGRLCLAVSGTKSFMIICFELRLSIISVGRNVLCIVRAGCHDDDENFLGTVTMSAIVLASYTDRPRRSQRLLFTSHSRPDLTK